MHLILWKKKWTLPNTFRFIGRKEGREEGRKGGREDGREGGKEDRQVEAVYTQIQKKSSSCFDNHGISKMQITYLKHTAVKTFYGHFSPNT